MDGIKDKVEEFVALTTTNNQDLANRISAALEDIGVPIVLEHVLLNNQENGYRISTQLRYKENASRIVDNHLALFATQRAVTTRETLIN